MSYPLRAFRLERAFSCQVRNVSLSLINEVGGCVARVLIPSKFAIVPKKETSPLVLCCKCQNCVPTKLIRIYSFTRWFLSTGEVGNFLALGSNGTEPNSFSRWFKETAESCCTLAKSLTKMKPLRRFALWIVAVQVRYICTRITLYVIKFSALCSACHLVRKIAAQSRMSNSTLS